MSDSMIKCGCQQCDFKDVVFENLDNNEISFICMSKKEIEYSKGEIIIPEGKKIDEFLYLKSGLVKLYKKIDKGKDQIIKIAKPFEFVSLLSVFSDTHYNYSISALEKTTVCVIDLNTIKDIITKNGSFGLRIMKRMSESSDNIIQNNIEMNKKNLRGRIAYLLLYFSEEVYINSSFELPLTRVEIAQLIDMTRENVIRIFSEFKNDNIIKMNGKIIEVADSARLQQISEFG